jgi:hypothetical protein
MFKNIPGWVIKPVVDLADKCDWSGGQINTRANNGLVNVCRY